MKKIPTLFPDVWIIEPDVFKDIRGFFFESYSFKKYNDLQIDTVFLQDNTSRSMKNTVRGLHFQARPGQVKLIRCSIGKIWDIVVDVRPTSKNFRKWFGVEISEENFLQIYIPMGYAHGFSVLSEMAEVQYKTSNYYDAKIERGFKWNDKSVGVDWRVSDPIISQRDNNNPSLDEYLKKYLDPFSP